MLVPPSRVYRRLLLREPLTLISFCPLGRQAAAALIAGVASDRRNSGGQQHQVGRVAPVQGQFHDAFRVDGVIERRRSGVDLGRACA